MAKPIKSLEPRTTTMSEWSDIYLAALQFFCPFRFCSVDPFIYCYCIVFCSTHSLLFASTMKNTDYYRYTPSTDAAIVVSVLYTLAAVGTVLQFLRYRSWVWTVMVIAACMESAGYITRIISTKNVLEKNIFVASYSLIVLAPVLSNHLLSLFPFLSSSLIYTHATSALLSKFLHFLKELVPNIQMKQILTTSSGCCLLYYLRKNRLPCGSEEGQNYSSALDPTSFYHAYICYL